jgi:hypothetical protein
MTDMFSAPASTQGINLDSAKGHLLLIEPLSQEQGVQTVHGPADPIRANVVDLDTEERFEDILVFPRVLISQLKPRIGGKVLGRLGRGTAKPGQSAPWVLQEFSSEDATRAKAYIEKQQNPAFSAPAGDASADAWNGTNSPF